MNDRLGRDPHAIRAMFDSVAARYDLLNRMLSMRRDVAWRRVLVATLADAPAGAVLDLATGTGDVAFATTGRRVVGADFTLAMLNVARAKAVRRGVATTWVAADAMALPFRSGSFAALTIAFGVRNFVDLAQGFAEMRRVLMPGGLAAILELHTPGRRALAFAARVWNRAVVTPIGRIISHDGGAYGYLPASIDTFPGLAELGRRLGSAGFELVRSRELGGGIAGLTVGRRMEAA